MSSWWEPTCLRLPGTAFSCNLFGVMGSPSTSLGAVVCAHSSYLPSALPSGWGSQEAFVLILYIYFLDE